MRRFFSILSLSSCLIVLSCEAPTTSTVLLQIVPKQKATIKLPEKEKTYKIIGIKDGDTFVALIEDSEQVIRLAHIDCPEKRQAFGAKAKQFAAELCFGKYVYIQLPAKNFLDRNKRLIAELVLSNGVNINKELVRNGYAWHYKKFSTDETYAALESHARAAKRGLWADENAIAPWHFRK
jgi:micrococcal nuclease